MKTISEALESYIEKHPFEPGDGGCETVLDQLYQAYAESHESDPPEIRTGFAELETFLETLPLDDNNAPIDPAVITRIKEQLELPVVATIVSEHQDIDERIAAGADILNISAAAQTPHVVAYIRKKYPDIPIIATGGPTEDSILETIRAGANAITYTPPTNGELFAKSMNNYRMRYEK